MVCHSNKRYGLSPRAVVLLLSVHLERRRGQTLGPPHNIRGNIVSFREVLFESALRTPLVGSARVERNLRHCKAACKDKSTGLPHDQLPAGCERRPQRRQDIRLGSEQWVCLPEGVSRVLRITKATGRTHPPHRVRSWDHLLCDQQARRFAHEHNQRWPKCCHVGCFPRKGGCPADDCRGYQLHGMEGALAVDHSICHSLISCRTKHMNSATNGRRSMNLARSHGRS
jgi:hypothetical protein